MMDMDYQQNKHPNLNDQTLMSHRDRVVWIIASLISGVPRGLDRNVLHFCLELYHKIGEVALSSTEEIILF